MTQCLVESIRSFSQAAWDCYAMAHFVWAVAGWPDRAKDLSDDEWSDNRRLFERVGPYLVSKGVMTDVLLAGKKLNRLDVAPGSDLSELLSDPVFLQMVSWRINSPENILLEVQDVEDSIHHILDLLEDGMDSV